MPTEEEFNEEEDYDYGEKEHRYDAWCNCFNCMIERGKLEMQKKQELSKQTKNRRREIIMREVPVVEGIEKRAEGLSEKIADYLAVQMELLWLIVYNLTEPLFPIIIVVMFPIGLHLVAGLKHEDTLLQAVIPIFLMIFGAVLWAILLMALKENSRNVLKDFIKIYIRLYYRFKYKTLFIRDNDGK